MRDLLEHLHRVRLRIGSLQAEYAEAKRHFEEKYADLLRRRELADLEESEATMAVRKAGLAEFRETGNLAPAPGIKIRMMTRLEYDPEEARRWAMNHRMAVKLDEREFEKLARATPANFDFVEVRQQPQVTIASDLGKVLNEEKSHANPQHLRPCTDAASGQDTPRPQGRGAGAE